VGGRTLSGGVFALGVRASSLFAAGSISAVGEIPIEGGVAVWDGSSWRGLGAVQGVIRALGFVGGQLHAGGAFRAQGCSGCVNLATFDGAKWNPVISEPLDGIITSIAADEYTLVIAGDFKAGNATRVAVVTSSELREVSGSSSVAEVHSISFLAGGCFAMGTAGGVVSVCPRGGQYLASDAVARDVDVQFVVSL
jgi:hypothetical protein